MLLIPILTLASLFSTLGSIQAINIPDPIILGLFGVAIFCIAAFIKRRHSWRQ